MHVIRERNALRMLPELMYQLHASGVKRNSRNGPVIKMPHPTTLYYERPTERVLFDPVRDANPFFHFFESLWMLAGRNDLGFMTRFVGNFGQYSDDGKTLHGAYGYRWREHFALDQLKVITQQLRNNPDDRRCVLGMWDVNADLGRNGKDLPCNTHIYFNTEPNVEGSGIRLNMTVCNRSNDAVFGAVGANVVHMSYLQEYVAAACGYDVGSYWQVSNNMHVYEQHFEFMEQLATQQFEDYEDENISCIYEAGTVAPYPLVSGPIEQWDADLQVFLDSGPTLGIKSAFFRRVAAPLWNAHETYKNKALGEVRFERAIEIADGCAASDWRKATIEWLARRRAAYLEIKNRAMDDGVVHD